MFLEIIFYEKLDEFLGKISTKNLMLILTKICKSYWHKSIVLIYLKRTLGNSLFALGLQKILKFKNKKGETKNDKN